MTVQEMYEIENGIKEIEAKNVATVASPPAKPTDMYIVIAYNSNHGWRLRSDGPSEEFRTLETAIAHAEKLSPMWTNRRVVKICLSDETT